MTAGRKRKPIEDQIREGNPGKRQLPAPIPLAPGAIVKPPHLPPAASELWDDIVPVLDAAGILNKVDLAALEAMCLQWQRAVDARAIIDAEGLLAFGSTGQLVEHPMVQTERQALQLYLRLAEQFGATSAARARLAWFSQGAAAASMKAELDAL